MFEDFDFLILEDSNFKEDAVREEIVVPILARLGYSASGQHRIVRSKNLIHPFVMIGCKKHNVSIIPDYFYKLGENAGFILDAKGPSEKILRGKNVEQAYSYAIHPEVRVNLYSLCNGREFVIYDISQFQPILVINILEINEKWDEIEKCLAPTAIANPDRRNFSPDFGLSVMKAGIPQSIEFVFMALSVTRFMMESQGKYVMSSTIDEEGVNYLATFDMNEVHLTFFVELFPEEIAEQINYGLDHQPFYVEFNRSVLVGVKCRRSEPIKSVNGEAFCPMIVEEIFESPLGTFSLV